MKKEWIGNIILMLPLAILLGIIGYLDEGIGRLMIGMIVVYLLLIIGGFIGMLFFFGFIRLMADNPDDLIFFKKNEPR